ncbi:C-type cytochrome biogenesis membrane protein [Xanthomonas fragariae]|nr:C-type cytochrome biogenesis membrane protein [Xanthomonas fragariae]
MAPCEWPVTPEFGQIALILALLLSLAQGVLPLIGAWRGNTALMGIARPAAVGQAVFVWMAFGLLAWSLLWLDFLDFSVRSVADNANIALPWYYRFAKLWGAHEGSLLLWIAIPATWTLLLAAFSRHLPQHLAARVLAVLGLVSVGFPAFVLRTSNPFGRLSPIPLDGNELNPVLQDPGMTFHPPVLYIGIAPVNRMLPLLGFLLPAALFGFGIYWTMQHNLRDVPSPLVGEPAPAFSLPRLDQPELRVSREQLLGKPCVLNDFGSWCVECVHEHPVLMAQASRLGVPESFLIDAQGLIRYKHIGVLTPDVIDDELLPAIAARPKGAP